MTRPTTKIHAALFTVAVLFSANYIISKIGMGAFPPLAFAWLRVAGSAIVLQAMLPRNAPRLTRSDWKEIGVLSLLGVVINQTLFLGGLSLTTAHVAAILIATIPVFTLGTAIALHRETATGTKIAGIALAAVGALLVIGFEGIQGTAHTFAGAVMIVINCLSFSIYLVVSKPTVTRLTTRVVLAPTFLIGTILMLPICAHSLVTLPWATIPARAWLALVLVILGPTVGAYLLNGWALSQGAESSLVAAYVYLQPVMTTFLAAIFLDERMEPAVGGAALLIFAGVWLSGRGKR
jgi:drug/metabolite transporter (DMT)-like permease